MANQIILAWKVRVAGTSLGPVQADAKLSAVPLYANPTTDPVLGQAFGLTVASDATVHDAVSATRTLTLNMTSAIGAPFAPPPFPCHPDTPTAPVLPYPLRRSVSLAGAFLTTNGSIAVPTSANQIPALNPGDQVQFPAQQGVTYTVAPLGVAPTMIVLTTPYTGPTADGGALKIQPAPVTRAALYSTAPADTNGVATAPAIPAGSGARTVSLTYLDSTGAGPFTTVTALTGKRPAAVALTGGVDIATIMSLHVASAGAFQNSVGQITLCELASPLPAIPANATPDDFRDALTDRAQLLVTRSLAYLPPSYFALTQQGADRPALVGDFFVTTGSPSVPTSVDQTAALAAGNTIQFAAQLQTDAPFGAEKAVYTIKSVGPALIELTTPYTGLDRTSKYDSNNAPRPSNVTANADKQPTGAYRVTPTASAPPTTAQLSAPLAQFVNPGNAVPPPNPPLPPGGMAPSPTFLSGLFTQTLQLALAVPVEPQPIAFA